ncbi:electron transfer flavoprotein subunit beta/FixA family protein [Hujiaoplasma nucleasis]|uniref:Electron transfer flavoprotein small subunit n=1 Tax=Hujiaoplasma nucleasis TaxID=2725268 RepID=A0A7L6N601_9MOLU|nr:electron transfer flavoprotein subunit beta/FixA family protein [Hujiaoplasma nucleasis]QLY39999.1 electron transfer flavoprotein subunit beta/FixA family protein [Hujiaoplasma nucleasis]
MKIVVCVKQVPNTANVKIDPVTGTMIREGVESIINPDDLAAVEAALRIKEQSGGEIIALTMGPLQADKALRECLAMGVDKAILLSDRLFAGADTWVTSLVLSKAIEMIQPDLVIAGRQAIDGDTAQVGPQIAEHLKIPSVAYVSQIDVIEDGFIVKRDFEDRYYRIKVKKPCLMTVLKELNKPRYMNVRKIYQAFQEGLVVVWDNSYLNISVDQLGLKGSPTKVKKSFTKGAKSAGKIFDVSPGEAATIIIDKLKENYVL